MRKDEDFFTLVINEKPFQDPKKKLSFFHSSTISLTVKSQIFRFNSARDLQILIENSLSRNYSHNYPIQIHLKLSLRVKIFLLPHFWTFLYGAKFFLNFSSQPTHNSHEKYHSFVGPRVGLAIICILVANFSLIHEL